MKKALMIGAMAVAAFTFGASQNASAKTTTYTYQFGTPSGGNYCDGISVAVDSKTLEAVGLHTYYQAYCPYKNLYAGGFGGTVKGLGKGTWYSLASVQDPGSGLDGLYGLTFYTNFATLQWVLALQSTYESIPFEIINEGVLNPPLSASVHPGKHLGTVTKVAIEKLKVEGKFK